MQWLPEYSVKVEEIDDQHKRFIVLINDLYDAIEIGSEDIVLGDIINQLVSYADYHFATEEKYFDEFCYDRAEEHKKLHDEFRKKVAFYASNYVGKEKAYALEISDFMKDWVVNHINVADKAFKDCFLDHGLI
jgi:hemerythrin